MNQTQLFVSHSSKDKAFCTAFVTGLRKAGMDVWYDEHNLGAGALRREIVRELAERPVFIVVLSRDAFGSDWVQDECEWAYNLYKREENRLILPVVGGVYEMRDFNKLLYLENMKRIEAPGNQPYSPDKAAQLVLIELGVVAGPDTGELKVDPTATAEQLAAKGKWLYFRKRYHEAIAFCRAAIQRNPKHFSAWYNLAYSLWELERHPEALDAVDHALAASPNNSFAWNLKGYILHDMGRHADQLVATQRAVDINPDLARNWSNLAAALNGVGRYQDALDASDRALAMKPKYGEAVQERAMAFRGLGRYEEALQACDSAIALNPNYDIAWCVKATVLHSLGRYDDALNAFNQALALNPKFSVAWEAKAKTLRALGREKEARDANRRAAEIRRK